MDRLVSDDVWHQLRPFGAAVARRTVVRFWAVGLAGIVVMFTAAIAWASGGVMPWLHETDTGWDSSVAIDDANGRAWPRAAEQTMILNVENHGWDAVRIVGVGDDGAGVRTLRATVGNEPLTPQSPYVLDAGNTVEITLFLRFTDCRTVSDQPWPIPIRIARPWGPRRPTSCICRSAPHPTTAGGR